jgi:hypothetical protein
MDCAGISGQFYRRHVRHAQVNPSWNQRFVDIFADLGWKDIGTSYYRMNTGTVLPTHGDPILKYIDLFGLAGTRTQHTSCMYFLKIGKARTLCRIHGRTHVPAGRLAQVMEWTYDTPHMAANIGSRA